MKIYTAVATIVVAVIILTFQNCGSKPFELNNTQINEVQSDFWSSASLKRNDSKVEYFGFYATAYDRDLIDQVAGISNLIHIDTSSGDINFIVAALKKAKQNNLAAIVSIQNIFYDCSGWNCEFRTRADSAKKWNQLRDQIKTNDLLSTVFSFYTDEPEMYARIREAKAAERGVSLKIDVISELEEMSSIVKADFPAARLQMTSAAFDVHPNMVLPLGFDIFGMDCYNSWESCGSGSNRKSIPEYYNILTQKIQALESRDGRNRSLVLLPPSFYVDDSLAGEMPSKATTLDLFDKYVAYSVENSEVIAIIPFLWPDHHESGKVLHGASGFSEFAEKIEYYFSGFQKPTVTCNESVKPSTSENVPCGAGYTGNATKTRTVTCSGSSWITGAWSTNTSSCQVVTCSESSKPSTSEVVSCGAGYKGNATKTRTVTCSGSSWITGAWSTNTSSCQVVTCSESSKPSTSEVVSCGAGYTGNATKTRTVTCSGSSWITGAWSTNTSSCQVVQQELPAPSEPEILRGGLGCEDNLCLWVVTKYLTSNYRVLVRDPGNYATSMEISSAHGLLRKDIGDGTIGVSFRIPNEALNIYRSRGLDFILVNQLNGKESMYYYRFQKP